MQVNCPKCGTSVAWKKESKFRPFCSKKCQLIDLGAWADEEHKITETESNEPQQAIDVEDIEAMLAKIQQQSLD